MVELLAPAGSYDSLKAAVNAGADAVYIGGSRFGARAYADNPEEELLIRGIDYCHIHGRQIYMTVNTLLKEQELEEELYDYLLPYYRQGLDGVIVQDFGVVRFIQQYFPLLPIHASTQMTVTGVDGAKLLKEQGICRVVPARELSLQEIRKIIEQTGLEVETFIHGAMCYSYSGQCLLSSVIGGRSGNRGRCAQPCRLPYELYERKPENKLHARGGSEKSCGDQPYAEKKLSGRNQYLMSLKDMCTIELLPELVDAGIASLKIEGRMKRPEYTAGVVSIYRKYLDRCLIEGRSGYRVEEEDRRSLLDLYSRGGFSEGYYRVKNGPSMMSMQRPNHLGSEAARVRRKKNGTLSAVTSCALAKGDVLEAAMAGQGGKGPEISVKEPVSKGAWLLLPAAFSRVRDGQILFRTRNEGLLEELRKKYTLTDRKEKIKGVLRLFAGKPAILKLEYGSFAITAEGAAVEKAQKRPLLYADIRRQLNKTGDSPFCFEKLDIEMEEELFLPLQALNQLRRDALEMLEQAVIDSHSREETCGYQKAGNLDAGSGDEKSFTGQNYDGEKRKEEVSGVPGASGRITKSGPFQEKDFLLNVSVMSEDQLAAVLGMKDSGKVHIDTIYLDVSLLFPPKMDEAALQHARKLIDSVKKCGIRCYLQMMPILRSHIREYCRKESVRSILTSADGFLVRTLDVLAFLQAEGYTQPMVSDDGFYAYNRRAGEFLAELGIDRRTLPSELNSSELSTLDTSGAELILYGRLPLMFTAQCLRKNTSGCTGIPSILNLRDRKQMEFPVRTRCTECCNVIYNSVPLNLFPCKKEIRRLQPSRLRIAFTIEEADEVKEILNTYREFISDGADTGKSGDGTRGHFRRGVE